MFIGSRALEGECHAYQIRLQFKRFQKELNLQLEFEERRQPQQLQQEQLQQEEVAFNRRCPATGLNAC